VKAVFTGRTDDTACRLHYRQQYFSL